MNTSSGLNTSSQGFPHGKRTISMSFSQSPIRFTLKTRSCLQSQCAQLGGKQYCSIARPFVTPSSRKAQPGTSSQATRAFTTSAKMKFTTPSSDPPKHEMAFFPGMTTSLPSESGDFRRVLWTGLYSQLVLMTVPVGGDIGDEVCSRT